MNSVWLIKSVDTLTPSERSTRMAGVKAKDTKPEMLVRRLLYALGFRYRLHERDLPGCPDIVFRGRKKAIFVHGCFWHRHEGCPLARWPKSRLEFWIPKLEGNRARDVRNQLQLQSQGWDALVIWECELKDLNLLEKKLNGFLGQGNTQ
ncbi:very short patch repair endonuclease [Pseudomonas entomophila]|uniref:very short patch repair endonuclease n=1 Tax=Pseudomonas entomophila TaxID=312306 RepID=UPI0023D85AAC|nr:very short patch repair endonuclease [Pseudomonas entomophila]MDF0730187.1 very short patch repair endonuclease [Pseudomonas entomophila]